VASTRNLDLCAGSREASSVALDSCCKTPAIGPIHPVVCLSESAKCYRGSDQTPRPLAMPVPTPFAWGVPVPVQPVCNRLRAPGLITPGGGRWCD